jgi:phage-related protein
LLIAVIAAGAFMVYKNWDWLKAKFGDIMDSISSKVAEAKEFVVGKLVAAKEAILGKWSDVTGFFVGVWDSVKEKASMAWGDAKAGAVAAKDAITGAYGALPDWMQGALSMVGGIISAPYEAGFEIVKGLIGFFKGDFESLPQAIESIFAGVKDIITKPFMEAFDWVVNHWNSMKEAIGLGEGGMLTKAGSAVSGAWSSFKDFTGFARGGLITHPTVASFAERGPEVAVPVSMADRGLGLASLDIASRALGRGGMSGGNPVTIESSPVIQVSVNGGDPAEIRRMMVEVMREYGAKMVPEWAAQIARTSYATG